MLKHGSDVFDITHYNNVSDLLKDLREISGTFDQLLARVMVRALISESRLDWLRDLLNETKGSKVCDTLIEGAIFELPISVRGSRGVVRMVLQASNYEIEIMAFQVVSHREGLLISGGNLLPGEYSDTVRTLCYEAMINTLSEHPTEDGKLIDGILSVEAEELSFLNGFAIDRTPNFLVKAVIKSLGEAEVKIDFRKSAQGLLARVRFESTLELAKSFSSWDKVKKISQAGSLRAVTLGPGIQTAPPSDIALDEGIKSSPLVEAELRLQMELISLAQSLEFMRSIEASSIKDGKANAKLINQCMKGIGQAKKLALDVRRQGSQFNFPHIKNSLAETIELLPAKEKSTHTLVRVQIDQMPLRHRRLMEAYDLLNAEIFKEGASL